MSRVITFSRTFPAYHPRKGESTYFVEKIHQWYWDSFDLPYYSLNEMLHQLNPKLSIEEIDNFVDSIDQEKGHTHKGHTIRAGNRWKVGDKFSPRVWSGKPYNSKQIIIAADIEIKKLWDIEIKDGVFFIGDHLATNYGNPKIKLLANNDGLNHSELLDWFKYPKPFKGQIICWNENINY